MATIAVLSKTLADAEATIASSVEAIAARRGVPKIDSDVPHRFAEHRRVDELRLLAQRLGRIAESDEQRGSGDLDAELSNVIDDADTLKRCANGGIGTVREAMAADTADADAKGNRGLNRLEGIGDVAAQAIRTAIYKHVGL